MKGDVWVYFLGLIIAHLKYLTLSHSKPRINRILGYSCGRFTLYISKPCANILFLHICSVSVIYWTNAATHFYRLLGVKPFSTRSLKWGLG